ncbi:MAG: helix-turn-helix transcriptional regulator [Paludibacteraceae bacterium]|nr:helix-turn-helix transcriptional regulator [Paludibacteraceae bacterium]HOI26784.1 helix-turn-helix transcriptional regulator [Paludibacteraceae bacterium]HQF50536.1 helix-turn-helix transcriptional regulator [Paludibacteraceae bacterium]
MMEHNNRQMERLSKPMMEPFSIRRLDESCYKMSCPTPMMRSIVNSFIYLSEGEVLIEGEEQKNTLVRANDFFLLPQGVAFSIKYYKDSVGYMGAFHSAYMGENLFSSEALKKVRMLQLHEPVKASMNAAESKFVEALLDRIYKESSNPKPDDALIKSFLLSALVELNRLSSPGVSVLVDHISNDFLEMIFDESKPILSVPDYASHFGITPNHLNKVIKKNTSKPVSQWIEESIIMRSKILLRETNMPVSEIAETFKLLDQSYFSRKFKKHEGISPFDYRKRNKKS